MKNFETKNHLKSEKEIYFMLKIDENGGYIQPVTHDGEVIDSFQYYNIENTNIKKVVSLLTEVQEDTFFIDWEKDTKNIYFDDFYELSESLKNIENFVNEDFQKIVWSLSKNELSLLINDIADEPDKLKPTILLNNKYADFDIISDGMIYRNGIIYCFQNFDDDLLMLKKKINIISRNELEVFLTLARHYYKNLTFHYMNYTIETEKEISGVPQIKIEKISQDNSLYIKIDLIYSTITQNFIEENELDEIIIVNSLEKKIYICKPPAETLEEVVEEITKLITKHQRKLGRKQSYFVDDDNLIIISEKVAKEFITKDLLQLAGKYKIIGTDKLNKYNIKAVKPKLIGRLNHSIDFLEGEIQLQIGEEKFSILEVLSKLKKDSYIVLGDGTNAIINKKYIEKLEKVFKKVDNKKVKISFFDLPIIDELIEDKILKFEINQRKEFFRGINEIENYKSPLPDINADLRQYQKYGYKWLCYLTDNKLGGCLADDMGLGKTLQAIALITRMHSKKKKRTLVVMPKSLIFNWENEIQKFSPNLITGIYYGNNRDISVFKDCEVILTTYGTVRNDIEKIKKYKFELIVLDESQNIKNSNAQTTKAVMLLKGNNRIALSGTPVENNLGELYSLFRFLNPPMFGSADEFNRYYAVPIHKENDKDAIEELRKKIYPFILRRIKKDVLKDLPDKIEKVMYVEMNPEQKNFYEERRMYYYNMVHENIRTQGFGKSHFYILQALNELRQITSCPESKNANIISSKRDVVIENVLDAVQNNHKVLIFANYISSIEGISKQLEKNGIKHLTMTGATKDRHILVDKFQNDSQYKVFVMTLKTGGVGLNLTAADTIFIYDPWWNKTVENQAVDRAYRLGQDRTVFSYKMILKDSIEEKILKLQETKNKLVENLISDEGTSVKNLSEDDIEFILGK